MKIIFIRKIKVLKMSHNREVKEIEKYNTITVEEIRHWTDHQYSIDYLHEIITGEYLLEDAREDVFSFRQKEGDLDVLSSHDGSFQLSWFENNGDGTGWVTNAIGNLGSAASSISTGDFDLDGDPDVLSPSSTDTSTPCRTSLCS